MVIVNKHDSAELRSARHLRLHDFLARVGRPRRRHWVQPYIGEYTCSLAPDGSSGSPEVQPRATEIYQ